jgi:hypothetical protein
MIVTLIVVQLVLPLVLLAGHALLPSASLTGLMLRTIATGLGILLLAFGGLWMFPPWWSPYAYALALAVGTLFAFRRLQRRKAGAGPVLRWSEIGGGAALSVAILAALVPLTGGRTAPAGAVDLAFPLAPGRYLIVNGGDGPHVNAHFLTLADNERFRPWIGLSYGVDIVGIDDFGLRASGIAPTDPAAYIIFGTGVLAPCDGDVVAVNDGLPDLPVPEKDRANLAGNFVLIACGEHHVALGHFRRGTIRVAVGERVETGMLLGEVGNSGNSDEPHLHIHVQKGTAADAPLSGEPVPLTLGGRFPVRNDRFVRM